MDRMSGREGTEVQAKPLPGMVGFTIVWIGQVFSLLGTQMTQFALTVWAWQQTGQATDLALVGFFNFVPFLIVTPVAGAIVDRLNRKHVMMSADFLAGLPTVVLLMLFLSGKMQIWHLFITGAVSGTFQAFHFPAYSAAITMMVRKEKYGRASGMLSTAEFASGIFAPVAAAIFLSSIGIEGVMIVDIITFIVAISMLFFVHVPQPTTKQMGLKGIGGIWKESLYGFSYILKRHSLLGLQLVMFSSNLLSSFGSTLVSPMILTRTGNATIILGSVMTFGGLGGLIGGITLSLWGGPKHKVHGVIFGNVLVNILGWIVLGLGRNWYIWAIAAFSGYFFIPILNGSNQAIWQAKVNPDLQGRVFASRLFIAQMSIPIGQLLAGPLADKVFEPAMMPNGSLAAVFGNLVGTGPGAGISLMFILAGIIGAITALAAYSFRTIRNAEDILPDHDALSSSS